MFKQITYKRKFQILLLVSLLFTVLIYQFALVKTVLLYKQNSDFDKKLKEASAAPPRIKSLQRQLESLDYLSQERVADTGISVHDLLLGFLSNYCKDTKTILKNYPETLITHQGEYEVQIHTITIQGSFIKMLQLVYSLEQKVKIGKVSSLNFQVKKDMDSHRDVLISNVYLQNIKKIKQ